MAPWAPYGPGSNEQVPLFQGKTTHPWFGGCSDVFIETENSDAPKDVVT